MNRWGIFFQFFFRLVRISRRGVSWFLAGGPQVKSGPIENAIVFFWAEHSSPIRKIVKIKSLFYLPHILLKIESPPRTAKLGLFRLVPFSTISFFLAKLLKNVYV